MVTIVVKKRNLKAEFTYTTTKIIWYKKFAPHLYYTHILHFFNLVLTIINIIRMQYGRILLKVKIKFHVNQIKIELVHVHIFVSQDSCQIRALKEIIKDVKSLEKKWGYEIHILKRIYK